MPKCLTLGENGFTYDSTPKLKQFLEAFHGCYKDGTRSGNHKTTGFDYRWIAGLYFILRVTIFAVYAFTPDSFIQLVFLQFLCIACIVSFLALRPYKNDFYNKLDASMFCLLVAINTLTMYNYYITAIGNKTSAVVFIFQYILTILPLIYISLVVVVYLYKKCCKGRRYAVNPSNDDNRECLVEHEDGGTGLEYGSDDYPSFVEQTGRLHGVNQYRPASASGSSNSNERSSLVSNEGNSNAKTTIPSRSSASRDTALTAGASNGYGIPKLNHLLICTYQMSTKGRVEVTDMRQRAMELYRQGIGMGNRKTLEPHESLHYRK